MSYPEETLQPLPFKDRRGRLTAGGILQIIVGIGCAFGLAYSTYRLYFFMHFPPGIGDEFYASFFGFCQFAVVTPWLLIMGQGSLSMRRWARSLTLIAAGAMLVMSIASLVISMPMIVKLFLNSGNVQHKSDVIFITTWVIGIRTLYVAFPGILILLYSGKETKRSCEQKNPQPSWTDQRPLPILAASFLLCFHLYSLSHIFTFDHYPLPAESWFGRLAVLLATALAIGLSFIIARGFYRLRTWAWWSAISVTPLLFLFVTALYVHTRYSEMLIHTRHGEQTSRKLEALTATAGAWLPPLLVMLCIWVFLFYTKRYFKNNAESPMPDHNFGAETDTVPPTP